MPYRLVKVYLEPVTILEIENSNQTDGFAQCEKVFSQYQSTTATPLLNNNDKPITENVNSYVDYLKHRQNLIQGSKVCMLAFFNIKDEIIEFSLLNSNNMRVFHHPQFKLVFKNRMITPEAINWAITNYHHSYDNYLSSLDINLICKLEWPDLLEALSRGKNTDEAIEISFMGIGNLLKQICCSSEATDKIRCDLLKMAVKLVATTSLHTKYILKIIEPLLEAGANLGVQSERNEFIKSTSKCVATHAMGPEMAKRFPVLIENMFNKCFSQSPFLKLKEQELSIKQTLTGFAKLQKFFTSEATKQVEERIALKINNLFRELRSIEYTSQNEAEKMNKKLALLNAFLGAFTNTDALNKHSPKDNRIVETAIKEIMDKLIIVKAIPVTASYQKNSLTIKFISENSVPENLGELTIKNILSEFGSGWMAIYYYTHIEGADSNSEVIHYLQINNDNVQQSSWLDIVETLRCHGFISNEDCQELISVILGDNNNNVSQSNSAAQKEEDNSLKIKNVSFNDDGTILLEIILGSDLRQLIQQRSVCLERLGQLLKGIAYSITGTDMTMKDSLSNDLWNKLGWCSFSIDCFDNPNMLIERLLAHNYLTADKAVELIEQAKQNVYKETYTDKFFEL